MQQLDFHDAQRARNAAGPATLEGTLERVVFSNPENGWTVVRLSVAGGGEPVTAVGSFHGLQPGESLRLHGSWVQDPKYGRQFRAVSYATVAPATAAGIERYLGSGLIRGIGKTMARRLVAKFGLETLQVIESQPERLAEVPGIGPKRRADIVRAWAEQRETREVMVFLQSHGIATGHALRIQKRYGAEALRVVRENPYRLALDIRGIGFRSADQIAAALGTPRDAPQRLEAGLLHQLSEGADRGHVYLPWSRLLAEGVELLGCPREPVERALSSLAAEGEVIAEPLPADLAEAPGDRAVYLKPLHAAETGVAERLRALLNRPAVPVPLDVERALAWFEKREELALAPAQREAIRRGLTSKLLVITGGPGTGKTTLVRGIVEILEKKDRTILLAAPTGRAAKRLAEATGREAATLHRLLEWNPKTHAFERNRDRPLVCDLLIVDESSMLDVALAFHLFRAVPGGGRVILVGDVDQLPSVGPGRVLSDLIRSGEIDVVRLTEIYRQAERSQIVTNAHLVNQGKMPEPGPKEGSDFFFFERKEPEEIVATVADLVARRIPSSFGFDPFEQIQVLTPMNRGLLGTESLNAVLRDLLNPHGREARGGLRIGDKVMQVRNNYELEVWNGDLGRVAGVDEEDGRVTVTIDGGPVVYEPAALDEVTLAYACTIHKSQGSEYPCVVIPLHTQHHILLQRNLLYTALTRARQLAVVVGERRALEAAVANRRTRTRYTLLAERLAALPYSSGPRPGGGGGRGSIGGGG